jgi:hypothetical protein
MAKLATCPGCTTQLALPENATLSDRARCPRCHEEFLLMETVQFSIPTAEILVHPEPETFSPTDTVNPNFHTPAPESYIPLNSDDEQTATSYESSVESITESEPTPLPASATLSDWEARLKRAIAGNADDQPTTKPTFESGNSQQPEAKQEVPISYEPHEFLVDDADLIPDAIDKDDWSARDSIQEQEERTIKFSGDQTFSNDLNLPQFDDDQEISSVIRTDSAAHRKKRKRSPWRTLISASMGVVGIPLGLYALLWLRGPAGDMLHIAQYLPSFMLPSEFHDQNQINSNEFLAEESAADVTETIKDSDTDQTFAENELYPEKLAADEPLIHEDTAVAPASAELPSYQGPTFDLVDPAKFSEVLAAAQQAAPQLRIGDLKTKESVANKGQAYMALAHLADKGTFLNQPGHSPADTLKAQAAEQLLESTLRDEIVQRDLPQIALRWWQYAQRPSPGIILIGKVRRLESNDIGTLVFVSLDEDPITPKIPVLISRADYSEGEIIGIVGSIEQNPHDRLPAIDSSVGPIVIAHMSFPLDPSLAEPATDR